MVSIVHWIERLAMAAIVLFVAGFLAFASSVGGPSSGPPPARADAIVALTGGEDRIDEAVRLLAEGKGRRLLISGVNPRTSRADLQRLAPGHEQQFDCCIDIGYWARDTLGNADEARAWADSHGFGSLIVVTSSYHMPRSLAELGRTMPEMRLAPWPVAAHDFKPERWWRHRATARLLVSEYLKLIPAMVRLTFARVLGTGGRSAAYARPASVSGGG